MRITKKDREIIDCIYQEAKEYFEIIDWDAPQYLKKLVNSNYYSVEELLTTEHDELILLIKTTIKQIQEVFDRCYDRFYCTEKTIGSWEHDPTNPESNTYVNVCNYINNFEKYSDKSLANIVLENKQLVDYLKSN